MSSPGYGPGPKPAGPGPRPGAGPNRPGGLVLAVKGAKADLVLFDPKTVIDHSTFEQPRAIADTLEGVRRNGARAVLDVATDVELGIERGRAGRDPLPRDFNGIEAASQPDHHRPETAVAHDQV